MAGIAGLIVAIAVAGLLLAWPRINVVQTGKTPEYPDLQPRRYSLSLDRVFDGVLQAVNRLPRWVLITHEPSTGKIQAEARSRVFRFVDDVRIQVTDSNGVTEVDVRSASRVGRRDFGQNARNVRAFFEALDQQVAGGDHHR